MSTRTPEFLFSTKNPVSEDLQEDAYFIKSAAWEEALLKDSKPTGKGSIFQYNHFSTMRELGIVGNLLALFQLTCPWHCSFTV